MVSPWNQLYYVLTIYLSNCWKKPAALHILLLWDQQGKGLGTELFVYVCRGKTVWLDMVA